MALKKLLNKGTVYKRSDNRWGGMVSYHDEQGVYRRKSFCAPTKKAVLKKIGDYIEFFKMEIAEADETKKPLRKSMQKWLEVFQYGTVERATYDRKEDCAKHYIYPRIGDMIISEITSADLNGILTQMMNEGYSHSTVKHVYSLFKEYFRYLCYEEHIPKNPMAYVRMIKKANFLAAQGREIIARSDAVTVLNDEEIRRLREAVFTRNRKGALKHQQAAAYLLMLNTGLRTGEVLGLLNSDIDLDKRELSVTRAVKEVGKRDKDGAACGTELIVGGMKTAASKRTIPLNSTAIEMILILRTDRYFGADSPLISNQVGDFTRPSTFRSRWYTLLDFAGISHKGLHSLRHTFATRLINGVEDENGNLKTLTVRQVADLLGHTTSSVTEKYYVRREPNKLCGITDEFEL
ncbi:tyrosine-type recombinase/integrase [Lachnoclostridium sp. MSJ-17]|uniref:tyrosine-type recombinase/integrase n=2 Tax=Clostridia TaxID=186801 RepID=UPI001C1220EE|nr:site-specific integrase [Lachnoclostridium sp. MSJ-17]MBU5461843.1 site-specific integrase [Lachnoclostridium sp. MSJ-17]